MASGCSKDLSELDVIQVLETLRRLSHTQVISQGQRLTQTSHRPNLDSGRAVLTSVVGEEIRLTNHPPPVKLVP